MSAVSGPGQDSARVAGETYAANTVGAIFGALLFSVVLVPMMGTQGAQKLLTGLAILSALIALTPMLLNAFRPNGSALSAALVIVALGGATALTNPSRRG